MAQVIADRRDVDFVLFEQLNIDDVLEHEKYQEFDKKTIDLIVTEARNLAIKEILPTLTDGDKVGLKFKNGEVEYPESFRRAWELYKEGEWVSKTVDQELGGQGLPHIVAQSVMDYHLGANYQFSLIASGGHGAGEMIELLGTDKAKELYLKKIYSGEWGGTMVMTEPEAGTDVGNLSTTAVKNDDGTYSITGNKIFITNAEHNLTSNIIHPVLARVEGAPKGSKGLSLFVVPKIWVNDDGSLGEANDVVCTGIEEKMGMHASPTCSLTFGGKGKCRGYLLGEENKGMRAMFHLMNAARLLVGAIGQTSASASYLHALNYAKERIQGRALENSFDHEAPPVPIINHPDVRRMLLWMKAHVEGMRSLIYFGSLCLDREKCAKTEQERVYNKDLLDLLTPIIKSYCTDKSFLVCSEAVQVFGGYGYTKDYPVEQLMRDVRIASIYEGTNGIQAMDLLGRKIGLKEGTVFLCFLQEIESIVSKAKDFPELAGLGDKLDASAKRLSEIVGFMGKNAMSDKMKAAFLHATPFQDVLGDVCMGWMLLWRATTAAEKMAGGGAKKKDTEYYQGQLKSASFFINSILPVTAGKMDSILAFDESALEISDAAFGT